MRFSNRDSLFGSLGTDWDAIPLALLLGVVLLEVVDYGHVVDFSLVFVSMISTTQLSEFLGLYVL